MIKQVLPLLCLISGVLSLAAPVKPRILSVGLATVDFIAQIDHFPKPDEKMRSTSLTVEGGGNAANTACAIARLSPYCEATLLTGVGDDSNGQTIVNGLEDYGVDVLCQKYPGSSPFTYIMALDVDGESTRTCVHQPASGELTVDFVKELSVKKYSLVHFDIRYPKAAVALAAKCFKKGVPISVDVERPREGLDEILEKASIVICSSTFCEQVDDGDNDNEDERLLRVMKKKAPNAKIAVETRGSRGSRLIFLDDEERKRVKHSHGEVILDPHEDEDVPCVKITADGALECGAFGGLKVVDTTGAGDSFIGGVIAALAVAGFETDRSLHLASLGHALRIGSRVAGQKVQKPGARKGLPSGSEDEFLKQEFESLQRIAARTTKQTADKKQAVKK